MEFNQWMIVITIAIVVVAAVLFITVSSFSSSKVLNPASGKNSTVTFSEAVSEFRNTTQSVLVHAIPEQNVLLYNGRDVNIVLLSASAQLSQNLTSRVPNATVDGTALITGGLIYPEIEVPPGANLNITYINLQTGDNCNLLISTVNPESFASSPVQPSQQLGAVFASPDLPPANDSRSAHKYSATIDSVNSDLWYSSDCVPSVYGHIAVSTS
ncbi:MAG: hypothetical protein KGH49_01665 [Candidatus Micrarchaeota archaeon]|nr:hypothetical protein [Candidatus Micrarchaeota archaeon]